MEDPVTPTAPSSRLRGRAGRIGRSVFWGVLVIALLWGWRRWDQAAFLEWKQEAGPVPYFTAMALLPAFGVPTTPFLIIAGMTFGSVTGLVGSLLSLSANFMLCYWLARTGLRRWFRRVLARWGRELPVLEGRQQLRFALLVKLAPGVPAFIKQYTLGVSGVSFGTYFLVSLLVTLPYAVIFVVLGESVFDLDWRKAGLALAGLVASSLLLLAIGRWWSRR